MVFLNDIRLNVLKEESNNMVSGLKNYHRGLVLTSQF